MCPSVMGSTGKIISFEVKGISEALRMLQAVNKQVVDKVDLEIVRLGVLIEEEVKTSVTGLADEPRSVRTGHFLNDIQMDKVGYAEVVVHAPTTEYADYLEYGTSKLAPRWHFTNVAERTKNFCKEKVEEVVIDVVRKENK